MVIINSMKGEMQLGHKNPLRVGGFGFGTDVIQRQWYSLYNFYMVIVIRMSAYIFKLYIYVITSIIVGMRYVESTSYVYVDIRVDCTL